MIMRYWLLFVLFLFAGQVAEASHLLGGEISYRCLGNGNFRFRVVVFRDCSGIPYTQTNLNLSGPVGVSCALIASYDVTPRGPVQTQIRCSPPANFPAAKGGIGKFVFEGTANLSSLAVAPIGGYTWATANIPCCRNSSNNSQCSGDMVLRVTMYRFVDPTGTALTPAEMCDNSPLFLEDPTAVTILNPFDTAVSNNFAQDLDPSDDVRFYIDFPWSGPGSPCNYNQGYTVTNPLPGLVGGQAIDSVTGVIRYRPISTGSFQTAIRAESRRCGQKISEIFRDFQLTIIANPVGSRPPFNPNASADDQLYQQKAPFFVPFLFDANGNAVYEVEIYAKDTLFFPLQAYDIYPLYDPPNPPAVPFPSYNPDSVNLFVTGPQMGTNGTSTTTGCLFPPCATLSQSGGILPIPISYATGGEVLGYGYRGDLAVTAQLNWVPLCSNLPDSTLSSCGTGLSAYQFGVVAFDDNSPVRGKSSQVYSVRLKSLPLLVPPVLRTVSVVNANAGVELSWSQYIDTTSIDPIDSTNLYQFPLSNQRQYSVNRRYSAFVSYRVYRSMSLAGPFLQVGQNLVFADTTFIDNTVVPNTQYYYYVATVSGCANSESLPSEVVKTVSLSLTNNIAQGLAELRWDSLGVNNAFPATGTPVVFIEREVFSQTPGVWERMDTVAGVYAWNQSVVVCDDSVNYRVGYLDSSQWISYSWVRGDRFEDNFAPDRVTVVQASVDNATGTAYLSWDASPSLDANRYVVYRVDRSTIPSTLLFLDTVYGYNSTFWYDVVSGQNPADSSLLYGIAAMDSCGNLGLVSTTFNTIHLEADMNQCISSMELSWNQYTGWGTDIREYEIMRRDGAGAPMLSIATIPANNTMYTYTDNQNLVQDTVYCYEIQAIRSNDSIAYSNGVCVQARVIKAPILTYIRKVSVDTATSLITVSFISDTAASSSRYELQRGTSTSDFQRITSVDVSQSTVVGPFHAFDYTDMEAKSGDRSYVYRVVAYDLCDQAFDTSQVAASIFLQGVPAIDFTNELKWNDYNSWLGGLETYTINRFIPAVDLSYVPLNTTGFGSPVFNDDITDFTDNNGNYLYFIEALEGNTNPVGLKDTVHSNVITVIQQPRIFFPNAFLPLGVNREFRGKGVFIEEGKGFNMQVYSRWGEKLFESTDFTLGWDGRTANDEFVMPGVYVYVVNFLGKNNKTYSQKGTLTILR